MMFSSNQRFQVSGANDPKVLKTVIDFAIRMSGCHEMFTRHDARVSVAYQITDTGMYLIGRGRRSDLPSQKVSEGWTEMPFDYDPEILAGIISQWLKKQSAQNPMTQTRCDDYTGGDGSTNSGFLCLCLGELSFDERQAIRNPFDAILGFLPFTCYYAK